MALWRISVKRSESVNGVRLEKGMFVDMVTSSPFSNPLNYNPGENKPKINNLFMSKYGIDMLKKDLITVGHLEAEKIS
jgi:hypothetical protein